MFKVIAHDVKLVAVSVIVSSFVIGVPAAAAVYANNSDKVDGKHAVGAKASPDKRAGKLVATNRKGLLPNDIILQAMDSDLLDGLSSADFLAADGKATDSEMLDGVDSVQLMRGTGYNGASIATVGKGFQTTRAVTHDDPLPVGQWRYVCPLDPTTTASWNYFMNNSSSTSQVYVSRAGSPGTWYEELPPGGQMFIRDAATAGANGGDLYTWTIVNSTMNVVVTGQTTSRRTADNCLFTARATESAATVQ